MKINERVKNMAISDKDMSKVNGGVAVTYTDGKKVEYDDKTKTATSTMVEGGGLGKPAGGESILELFRENTQK